MESLRLSNELCGADNVLLPRSLILIRHSGLCCLPARPSYRAADGRITGRALSRMDRSIGMALSEQTHMRPAPGNRFCSARNRPDKAGGPIGNGIRRQCAGSGGSPPPGTRKRRGRHKKRKGTGIAGPDKLAHGSVQLQALSARPGPAVTNIPGNRRQGEPTTGQHGCG